MRRTIRASRRPTRARSSSPTTTRATPPALLSQPVRRGGHPDARRRRRVEHGHVGMGEGNRIQLTDHLAFPHSLGLLYSAFTYYCGFKVNSGEYKLMGLAPYGRPIYEDLILEHLIDLKPDGSFWLDMDYFNYCQGLTMTGRRFHELFGGPPRAPESRPRAAAHGPGGEHPGRDRGGRAAHRPARPRADRHEEPGPGRRRRAELRGQRPAAARGAVRGHLDPAGRRRRRRRARRGAVRLAPAARASRAPSTAGTPSRAASSARASRTDEIARFLAEQAVQRPAASPTRPSCSSTSPSCWPTGRSSAGSRAGWSSARARWAPQHPRRPPLADDAGDDEPEDQVPRELPAVRPGRAPGRGAASGSTSTRGTRARTCCWSRRCSSDRRVPIDAEPRRTMRDDPDLRNRVNVVRSTIPAVTHVDYSARVQTVDEDRNPRFYRAARGLRAADRLPGARQHQLQRPRRADRLHARGRVPLLPGHRDGRAGARGSSC